MLILMVQKLIIAMQIGSKQVFDILQTKLVKFDNSNNLFLVSVMEDISDQVFPCFINQHVTFHPNIGMDIGPFLLQIKMLQHMDTSEFTHIYKIHTKTSEKWRNELLNIDFNDDNCNDDLICSSSWLRDIDVYNYKTILQLCEKFNIPNIYYDIRHSFAYDLSKIDLEFYSSYYNLKLSSILDDETNKKHVLNHAIHNKHVLNESQIKHKYRRNVKFVAGTIFAIKTNILLKFFENIDIDEMYNMLEPNYSTNKNPTIVHALERILTGFLC